MKVSKAQGAYLIFNADDAERFLCGHGSERDNPGGVWEDAAERFPEDERREAPAG